MCPIFLRGSCLVIVGCLAGACAAENEAARTGAEIEAVPIATLGEEGAGGGVGPHFTIAESPTGEWLLSYFSSSQSIMAFAHTGDYLRSVGRRGQGPGEFRRIQHVTTSDSLIHVLDVGQRRWSRLTPDLEWLDSCPIEVEGPSLVVLGDTAAVLNVRSFRFGTDAPAVRVKIWGSDSVGGLGDTLDLTDPLTNTGAGRILAPGDDDSSVWVGYENRYRVEHWGITGELRGVVERTVEWFPVGSGSYLPTPEEAPPPRTVGVYEDSAGRLWVAIAVPDEEWVEGVVKSEIPEGTGFQIGDPNRFLDTVIEVLDPASGEVLATRRFDAALTLIPGGSVASYQEDEGGVPRIEIMGLVLRR